MRRRRKEVWMIESLKKPRSQLRQRTRNSCSRPWPANWPEWTRAMAKLLSTSSKSSSTKSCRYSKSSSRNSSNLSWLMPSSPPLGEARSKINSSSPTKGTRGRKRRGRRQSSRSRNRGCCSRREYPSMTTSMMTYTRCWYRARVIREPSKSRVVLVEVVGRKMRTRNLIISEVLFRRISPTTTYISSSTFKSRLMRLIWIPWI